MKKIYEDPQLILMRIDTGDCMSVSDGLGEQADDVLDYSAVFNGE